MKRNQLLRGGSGLCLLLLLSLLIACRPAKDESAGAPGEAVTVIASRSTATARPTAVTTDSASATEVSSNEVAGMNESKSKANADVEFVRAVQAAGGSWTFQVTVRHPDTGWEDYADGWDVVTPDGSILKRSPEDPFTRLLLHPHESEQPFTRSQSGLVIPAGVSQVTVRAHDLVAGFGGRQIVVDLDAGVGPDFVVERP